MKPLNARPQHQGRLNMQQRGMTLLEVLVAVIVLTLGVLALLATQLRTVSGVREANSQTVVAQAVQNLIEGMLVNPTGLAAAQDSDGNEIGWRNRSYEAYHKDGKSGSSNEAASTSFGKDELAADQLARFERALSQGLPGMPFDYAIGLNGNDTVITVTWQQDAELNDTEQKQAGSSLNINKDGRSVLTYTARVSQ